MTFVIRNDAKCHISMAVELFGLKIGSISED